MAESQLRNSGEGDTRTFEGSELTLLNRCRSRGKLGSVVNWNGIALVTTFVNGIRLTASVPTSDVAKAATPSVSAVPGPGEAPRVWLSSKSALLRNS
jgi:hypothetical protein